MISGNSSSDCLKKIQTQMILTQVKPRTRSAFTLIEMLVVISIIVTLMAASAPVLDSMTQSGKLGDAGVSINGIIEQARSRARVTGLWHWIGFRAGPFPGETTTFNQVEARLYHAPDGVDGATDTVAGVCKKRTWTLESVALSPDVPEFPGHVRPQTTMKLPKEGGWLVVTPSGSVRMVNQVPDWKVGDKFQLKLPMPDEEIIPWLEIGLVPTHGVKPTNSLAIQIAGLTGQSSVHLP